MDPDPRKEIEVDMDPERGLKWIRIRSECSGSGSETLSIIVSFEEANNRDLSPSLIHCQRRLIGHQE